MDIDIFGKIDENLRHLKFNSHYTWTQTVFVIYESNTKDYNLRPVRTIRDIDTVVNMNAVYTLI